MSYSISGLAISEDGSVTFGSSTSQVGIKAGQIIVAQDTESIISFECDTRTTTTTPLPNYVILMPSSYGTSEVYNLFYNVSPIPVPVAGFKKLLPADPVTAIGVTGTITQSASSRLTMQIRGGLLRYFQDVSDYSTGSAFGTQQLVVGQSYGLFAMHDTTAAETAKILRPVMTRSRPSAFYSAADQVVDFGSAQASVHVKIYQMSSLLGRGAAGDATI